jgi:hypothetical protein
MRLLIAFLAAIVQSASAETPEAVSESVSALQRFDPDSTTYALAIVFILTFILTFYVGVLFFRERRRIHSARLALAETTAHQELPIHIEPLSLEQWRSRALAAESVAGNQAMVLREQLMPELTEFVKQSLVQGLASQRDALLAMQQQALNSIIEMESRLAALQAPMQERIRAYETRIAELEREISTQSTEMRELTRTILQLMRKKLDEEQAEETFH